MNRIIFIAFLLVPGFVSAQDLLSDTVTWESSSYRNLKTGNTLTRDLSFVTYGASRFDFVFPGQTLTFDVTSYEGTWADLAVPGNIVFHIITGDTSGTVEMVRDGAGKLTLTIDLTSASPDGIKNQYFVDQATTP